MNLTLQHVTKHYGRQTALDDVSLDICAGSIVAILGRNGAGKSTLLRAIATVSTPDKGSILLNARALTRGSLELRRQLMFLPDFPVLFARDTVLKNLSIILRLYECDTEANVARLTELLAEFDMLECAEKNVSELSRGQAYKAALIALLAVQPRLWLLDEPFASGMDPNGLAALKRHMKAAAAAGCTILFSTQIMEVAEPLADVACILEQGRVAAFGTMQQLLAERGGLEEIFAALREE